MDHEPTSGWGRTRLARLLLGVPVFVKVMGIALGVTVVLGAGMLWQLHRTWHLHLLNDLDQRGHRLLTRVSVQCEESSRAGRIGEVREELQRVLHDSEEMVYAVVEHTNGVVLAEARSPNEFGAAPPIRELSALLGHGPYQLRLGFSIRHIEGEVTWLTRRLARTTAIIALLGMATAWWLTRLFAQPIEQLVGLARAVKGGDYHGKAPVQAGDEIGELGAAFNQMTTAIAQKEEARQQLLRKVIHAAEEERKRIARELHDDTGQALTSQIAALVTLQGRIEDPAARRRLLELRLQTEQILAAVHDLAVDLRPSVLDDVGLSAALNRHCRLVAQRFGVQVAFMDLDLNDRRLPAEVELTLYRVVQEALTNALRHGDAGRISALVQFTPRRLLAIVRDNGRGFDARDWQKRCLAGNHLGLLGLEERVNLIGGSFCVDSEPGKGAAVYADVPLPQAT